MTAALIVAFLQKFWMPILSVIVGAWWGWKQRRAGAASVRAEQDKADKRALEIEDDVQNDIGAMSPEQIDAELRRRARN